MRTCLAVCLDEQNKLQPFTTPLHQLEEIFKLSIPISTILFIVIIGRFQLISLLQENDDALHPSLCSSNTSLHLGGLIYWSKGLRFGGLQLSIDKKKYQIYQQRHFHYITLLVQQRLISFKNILFGTHHKITSNKWSSIYQQRSILESYYIQPWQPPCTIKSWHPHTYSKSW